jgi:site-specific DNA-methyltransferase (adenine-specific)
MTIELLNVDCMVYMATLQDKAFDLALVDPPYGIGVNQMNMGGRKTIRPDDRQWDKSVPTAEYFQELKRVSSHQIIWGGNYFDLPPSKHFLIWDKGETMYGRDFAECEFAWSSMDKTARMFKMNPNQLDRIHPTQKPIRLYEWLLTNYAKPGQRILDTHLGSGSSAIAAKNFGVDFVGCELDKDYYDAACLRFKNADSQDNLFAILEKPEQDILSYD